MIDGRDVLTQPRPPLDALTLRRISKRFESVQALDDVSLTVRPGTVHALLGENGAGKTTLMHVAYGMLDADDGTMQIDGAPIRIATPADAIAAGIGMVHQHFTLVPAMTVAENLALGGRGCLHRSRSEARVHAIAERTGFELDPRARVEELPVGAQQRVEIAKALSRRARVLVLDEPTAVLAPAEVDELLAWLRGYVAAGNAAVLITHKLREALAVADDVTVLRRGRVTFTGPASSTSAERLTHAMIGEDLSPEGPRAPEVAPPLGAPCFVARRLEIRDASGITRVRDASFTVHGGEIVGVAGVEGAGHHELLRALAGRAEHCTGTLERPSIVGFIPEDRHRDAVLMDRSLAWNVALRGAATRRGLMRWRTLKDRTTALMRAYDVRAPGPQAVMRSLSGGNQQKLVVARELAPPDGLAMMLSTPVAPAMIVENPTRGLDVRASADVHARLRDARDAGSAVVVYSSDLDEVLALASRVLVIFSGIVRELPVDRELVGRAMLGLE